MEGIKAIIGDKGGISLPPEYQQLLGIKPGDEVIMKVDYGEIHIIPSKQAVWQARQLVRKYIPPGRRLVDELILDRRKDVKNE